MLVKYDMGILMSTALNLKVNFGHSAIFTILILPIQEHGFPSSSIFLDFFFQSLDILTGKVYHIFG